MDEMRLLEEQARRIAEEARKDKPKSMTFVKLVTNYSTTIVCPLHYVVSSGAVRQVQRWRN